MENEFKKLIEKWKSEYLSVDGDYIDPDVYVDKFINDLQSLLELYQSRQLESNKEIPTIHDTIYENGEK